MTYDGTTYYYTVNIQGDVTGIVDENGNVLVRYTYQAYGTTTFYGVPTGSVGTTLRQINPLTYRGYVYDKETKLYYLQSRYYNRTSGRFINADAFTSTDQGLLGNNMFAYCGNNPVCRNDFTGKLWGDATYAVSLENGGARILDVLVISIGTDGWMASSDTMGRDMATAVGADAYTVVAVTAENFAEVWNGTTAEYVIIHTHGSPNGVFGDDWAFYVDSMECLQRNTNIQNVLITACSAGGNNGSRANVGQTISGKINPGGIVICSTTPVLGGSTAFSAQKGGRWLVYRDGICQSVIGRPRITMSFVGKYFDGTISGGCGR